MAARIVSMAEREQAHRHESESKVIQFQIDEQNAMRSLTRSGQVLGAVCVLIMSASVVMLGYFGLSVPASVVGAFQIAAVAGIMVSGRLSRPDPARPPDGDAKADDE